MALLAPAAQAQTYTLAPCVGAAEADKEFSRIGAGDMAIISAKKGMLSTRSFGLVLLSGINNLTYQNSMYKLYFTSTVADLLNNPWTSVPSTFFNGGSPYAPNNKILHYLSQVSPAVNRLSDFNNLVTQSPYTFGNVIDYGMVEWHCDTSENTAYFNTYVADYAAWKSAYPNVNFIYCTGGLFPPYSPTNDAPNAACWSVSNMVMNPANGLVGHVPIMDWRSILCTHADGTLQNGAMCPEFNVSGDHMHPDSAFATNRIAQAFYVLLWRLYCNPGLIANAGFNCTVTDNDRSGAEAVTLDGSHSVASDAPDGTPGKPSIVRYLWKEGAAVLADSSVSTATVNLPLGVHTITLTCTDNRTPPSNSSDTVVITVSPYKYVVANAGADITCVEDGAGFGFSQRKLDGSGSTCPGGGSIVSYVWTEGGNVIESISHPVMDHFHLFYIGNHTVTLTVTDNASPPHSDSDTINITVTGLSERCNTGLQAFYEFLETSGSTVNDTSGLTPLLNMTIATPSAISWATKTSGHGLKTNSEVLIATAGAATKIHDACIASNEITLEAWIKPASAVQNGPACILTDSADNSNRNFTLGQGVYAPESSACYNGRVRASGGGGNNGDPVLTSADGSTSTSAMQHVVYTRVGSGNSTLYINGAQVATGYTEGLFSGIWNTGYRLALADEITLGRPWLGMYYLAAVYSHALTSTEVNKNYTVGLTYVKPRRPLFVGFQALIDHGVMPQELHGLTANYIEPRPLNTIVANFSRPISPASATASAITLTGTRSGNLASRISSVSLDATRQILTFNLTNMPVADKITITLVKANVVDQWGTTVDIWTPDTYSPTPPGAPASPITFYSLLGDVNRSGKVTDGDLLAVRANTGQVLNGINAVYDLDGSGTISGADMLVVRQNLDNTTP